LIPEIVDPATGNIIATTPPATTNSNAKTTPKTKSKGSSAPPIPRSPIEVIAEMLQKEFPQCRGGAGHDGESDSNNTTKGKNANASSTATTHLAPHMTIGQFAQDEIETWRERLQANWEPVEFDVTEISLIAREGPNDNFGVRITVPLPAE
jgi:hypothetical protein